MDRNVRDERYGVGGRGRGAYRLRLWEIVERERARGVGGDCGEDDDDDDETGSQRTVRGGETNGGVCRCEPPHLAERCRSWEADAHETIIEYPAQGAPDPNREVVGATPVSGRFPIVVYVHGYGAHADDPYLHPWAAAGFIAVSPKFPLTNTDTPGGPNLSDITNEPADVSFVLSQVLRLAPRDSDLQRIIDPTSIGVMGASAGATVAFQVTYPLGTRDKRIKAAIEQSGGCQCPSDTFPVGVQVPLMVMHGTLDPAAPYQWSTREYAAARSPKDFVSLVGAKHVQYDEPWLSISERASIDFFDRYLKTQNAALHQLATDANVPGRARLQQG